MKKSLMFLILVIVLLIFPFAYSLELQKPCNYDKTSRDLIKNNCESCGLLWSDSKCCDESTDNFCSGKMSCVNGKGFVNHCKDGVKNCDEPDVDCGGNDCQQCCSGTYDNVCPLTCSPDKDYDCCTDRFNGFYDQKDPSTLPWSDIFKCCDKSDESWCSLTDKKSCVNGNYFSDHCNDKVKNCDETSIDCGGVCKPCLSIVKDDYCPSVLFNYPNSYMIENDPDCCELASVGGVWQDGNCCWAKSFDWCAIRGGSCISGKYYQSHCSDNVFNTNCKGMYNFETMPLISEENIDCGGDCESCVSKGVTKVRGQICNSNYECMDGYCSGLIHDFNQDGSNNVIKSGVCANFPSGWQGNCYGSVWNGNCCFNSNIGKCV
jgi:hypothetical protein